MICRFRKTFVNFGNLCGMILNCLSLTILNMQRANLNTYQLLLKPRVSNLFRPRATEREYSGEKGHIVNYSLSFLLQILINNYAIEPNSY